MLRLMAEPACVVYKNGTKGRESEREKKTLTIVYHLLQLCKYTCRVGWIRFNCQWLCSSSFYIFEFVVYLFSYDERNVQFTAYLHIYAIPILRQTETIFSLLLVWCAETQNYFDFWLSCLETRWFATLHHFSSKTHIWMVSNDVNFVLLKNFWYYFIVEWASSNFRISSEWLNSNLICGERILLLRLAAKIVCMCDGIQKIAFYLT